MKSTNVIDKTNYAQSLMHMIKGNLGTGVLAMAKTFSHAGLLSALISLPLICLVNTYCVHLLIRSCERLHKPLVALRNARRSLSFSDEINSQQKQTADNENNNNNNNNNKQLPQTTTTTLPPSSNQNQKNSTTTDETQQQNNFEFADYAEAAFLFGPPAVRAHAWYMRALVVATLLSSQVGVCCVYLVFVVDNIKEICLSSGLQVDKNLLFACVFPLALSLCCVRTLRRLSIASACANCLQALGICIIVSYLIRDTNSLTNAASDRSLVRPANETAMAFATAMFAFEGVAVVIPVYERLKKQAQMTRPFGIVDVSYFVLMCLYLTVGLLGYLRFGENARDSITLDLPNEPIFDLTRLMFAGSILLSYPLQFYVLNEILWNFVRNFLVSQREKIRNKEVIISNSITTLPPSSTSSVTNSITTTTTTTTTKPTLDPQRGPDFVNNITYATQAFDSENSNNKKVTIFKQSSTTSLQGSSTSSTTGDDDDNLLRYEYAFRASLVSLTFAISICVPKLNFLMDLVGSISATLLCLIIPAIVHMSTFWLENQNFARIRIVLVDSFCIIVGVLGGTIAFIFSIISFIDSFDKEKSIQSLSKTTTQNNFTSISLVNVTNSA